MSFLKRQVRTRRSLERNGVNAWFTRRTPRSLDGVKRACPRSSEGRSCPRSTLGPKVTLRGRVRVRTGATGVEPLPASGRPSPPDDNQEPRWSGVFPSLPVALSILCTREQQRRQAEPVPEEEAAGRQGEAGRDQPHPARTDAGGERSRARGASARGARARRQASRERCRTRLVGHGPVVPLGGRRATRDGEKPNQDQIARGNSAHRDLRWRREVAYVPEPTSLAESQQNDAASCDSGGWPS